MNTTPEEIYMRTQTEIPTRAVMDKEILRHKPEPLHRKLWESTALPVLVVVLLVLLGFYLLATLPR